MDFRSLALPEHMFFVLFLVSKEDSPKTIPSVLTTLLDLTESGRLFQRF